MSDSLSQGNNEAVVPYQIKSQDILQIRNLQDIKSIANETALSSNVTQGNAVQGQTYQVEEDGTVALPGLGHVPVVGLTRAEAQKKVEELYIKYGIRDPIIELKITNLKITILGEVKLQGSFTLTKEKTTLIELIGEAGGLTEKADEKNVKIIRGTAKTPKVTIIDLNNILSVNSTSSILQSGDIIYIAQNKRAVRVDNLQNVSSIYQPALILLNTALIILTLIRR